MSKNMNLSEICNPSKNRTYFIHIKKSDISDIDDLSTIKSLLEYQLNESINIDEFKFINKSNLVNKSYKEIGKYLKSNKQCVCAECNTEILSGTIFKQLDCKHRFHVSCIDNKLKKDMYKKCTCCNTEHISASI
jgi:hypothetical protein